MDERLSDSEREQAVGLLKEHLLAGRLTLEEFSERVEQEYGAVVHADLRKAKSETPRSGSPGRFAFCQPSA